MIRRTSKIVVLVLLASGLSACASVQENLVRSPAVELRDVNVVGLGFNHQTFLLTFAVTNPNAFSLPVSAVKYGLQLDGQRFASGETVSKFTVPARGDAQFAISVDLDLIHTAPQLLAIIRDGTRQAIGYKLTGQFAVDLPFAPAVEYQSAGTIKLNTGIL